jgi:hypothetical protein
MKIGMIELMTGLNSLFKEEEKIKSAAKDLGLGDYDFDVLSGQTLLDLVYMAHTGKVEDYYYNKFTAPSDNFSDKPIAWYKGIDPDIRYSIEGPPGHKGFIPDCINNLIFDSSVNPYDKATLLERMFGDLEKIEKGEITYENSKLEELKKKLKSLEDAMAEIKNAMDTYHE